MMLKRIRQSIVFQGALILGIPLVLAIISLGISHHFSSRIEFKKSLSSEASLIIADIFKLQSNFISLYQEDRSQSIPFPELSTIVRIQNLGRKLECLTIKLTKDPKKQDKIKSIWSELEGNAVGHLYGDFHLPRMELIEMVAKLEAEIAQHIVSIHQQAENYLENLHLAYLSILTTSLILAGILYTYLGKKLIRPLRKLDKASRAIGQGDLSQNIALRTNGEFGQLAKNLDDIQSYLADTQQAFKSRVKEKNEAFKHSKEALDFLYRVAHNVSQVSYNQIDIHEWLKELCQLSEVRSIDLCLKKAEQTDPYEHIRSDYFTPITEGCRPEACANCIVTSLHRPNQHSLKVRYPIIKERLHYGVMVCNLSPCTTLQDWQNRLFQSFSDQVSLCLHLENQMEKESKVSLMNKHQLFTKELHNSFTESLNRLEKQVKILSTRLDSSIETEPNLTKTINNIVSEISEAQALLADLKLDLNLEPTD